MTNQQLENTVCQRAAGYLDLGMPEDALEEVDTLGAMSSRVLQLRVEILFRLSKWDDASEVCLRMVETEPGEPAWWIQAAYALRRSQSLDAAEPVLQAGYDRHPDDILICYNLACYACVQGRHSQAKKILTRAILKEPEEIFKMAVQDPDLLGILPWVLEQRAGRV